MYHVCESSDKAHSNNVDKVVLAQCVQDGVDGVLGDGHLQALHAATDVHHDDDIFGGRSSLDVPNKHRSFHPFKYHKICLHYNHTVTLQKSNVSTEKFSS